MNPLGQTSAFWRGLGRAVGGAVLIVALYVAAWAIYHSAIIMAPDGWDRQYDLRLALSGIQSALVFCAALGAAAGVTSGCCVAQMSFAASLLLVLVGSLLSMRPIMWLLGSVGLELRAVKGDQPDLLLSEVLVSVVSPAIAAVVIIVTCRKMADRNHPTHTVE